MNLIIKTIRDLSLFDQEAALKCAHLALVDKIPIGGVKRYLKPESSRTVNCEHEFGFLTGDFKVWRTEKNLYVEKCDV